MGKPWPLWARWARDEAGTRWISGGDLTTLFGLTTLTGLAWSLPEAVWPGLARRFGPLAVPMVAVDPAGTREAIARVAGDEAFGRDPQGLLERLSAEQIRAVLQLLRAHRPGGWQPQLTLDGGDHVAQALARGRGAILWVTYSIYGELVAKMAFKRGGLAVDHLSRPSHGFSGTRFGRAILNPVQTRAEARALRRRVVLDEADPGAALGILEDRLGENGVVSITVHRNARRPLLAPFLGGEITLAPGAPLLAHRSGAALLPVFPFRDGENSYRVTIGAPIELPSANGTGAALAAAAADYAGRLEGYVRRYPHQWRGWVHL